MRVVRGFGALIILLATVVGVPVALSSLGGNPFSGDFSWSEVRNALLRPDDGSVMVKIITVVGWLAWFVFALSLLVEMLNIASGYRLRIRLPGLGVPQRLVAGLLLSVTAIAWVPQSALADARPRATVVASPVVARPAPADPFESRGPAADSPARLEHDQRTVRRASDPGADVGGVVRPGEDRTFTAASALSVETLPAGTVPAQPPTGGSPAAIPVPSQAGRQLAHAVRSGDDLWSLAVQYYGDGRAWRKIAKANPHLLTGGPDRLQVGWTLVIPGVGPAGDDASSTVTVRQGDSLSAIADRELGEADRWPEIFRANRERLSDPDQLEVGQTLQLPQTEDATEGKSEHDRGAAADQDQQQDHDRMATDTSSSSGSDGSGSDGSGSDGGGADKNRAGQSDSGGPRPDAGETEAPQVSPVEQPEPRTTEPPAEHQVDHEVEQVSADPDLEALEVGLGIAAVGGLLAAGVIGGLAARRRLQLHQRPIGTRIQPTEPAALQTASGLARRQRPLSLRSLDLALRAISAHSLHTGDPLPGLQAVLIDTNLIELIMVDEATSAPLGFQRDGDRWFLDHQGLDYLRTVPGLDTATRPYAGLLTLGEDDQGRLVLIDLERAGVLSIDGSADMGSAFLAAAAVELSFSPWAEELELHLVGASPGLPDALGHHNVNSVRDLDELLDRWEHRQTERHQALAQPEAPGRTVMAHRVDPDLAEPWAPQILLMAELPTEDQLARLRALTIEVPRLGFAAVLLGKGVAGGWTVAGAEDQPASPWTGRLSPIGLQVSLQTLPPPAAQAVQELVRTTGISETLPAPWWSNDGTEGGPRPDPPPDNVKLLGRRLGGWDHGRRTAGIDMEGGTAMTQAITTEAIGVVHHPTLRLLGPVDLIGATGAAPPRAQRQCLEYCAWLLEHPGTTAQAMAGALMIAEGTRRSNMSRLRTWLGTHPDSQPYLPDAYTGRILLHESVSSDWQRLQLLTSRGVNRSSDDLLRLALQLVRGAPLADAAPNQWAWAEGVRVDMISAVRDIAWELSTRALANRDIELARWAAARGLVAAPGDEPLLTLRIQTEQQAGNYPEVERLILQMAAHARAIGVDLSLETVDILQEVMEGQARARLA